VKEYYDTMGKPTLFQLPEEYDCSGNQGRNCIAMANLLKFFIPAQICRCLPTFEGETFQKPFGDVAGNHGGKIRHLIFVNPKE
jgi:hypothetical protein